MRWGKASLLVILILCSSPVRGAGNPRNPHVGYLYPAGGQRGTKVIVTAGGQNLRSVKEVYVSGEGISASIVKYKGQLKRLNQDQKKELGRQVRTLRQKKTAAVEGRKRPRPQPPKTGEEVIQPVDLPDHPLIENLDQLSMEGLDKVVEEFIRPSVLQINPQIAETVVLEVAIDDNAQPGRREIRLVTDNGLTNPLVFEVGTLPEAEEPELADPGKTVITPVTIPVMINGQILPGEVDRFRFTAGQGQRLVIETQARKLIPYLGDAVPGWFQAILRLLDEKGREVAFADDWRFDPDPVLYYEIPKTADYILEINDAIYRGREDFVYRISIAERPFITSVFPLGLTAGISEKISLSGWNLSEKEMTLRANEGEGGIRQTVLEQGVFVSNPVVYAVDAGAECEESNPNDSWEKAQKFTLPQIVNGRIEKPGDRDIFAFKGKAGQTVVAEVFARRLNSPLDSLLRLKDESGSVLEWNDDYEDRQMGLETHHADSRLTVCLPRDGVYYAELSDAQSQGGDEYGYRLHVGPPQPDFALYVTPSSLNLFAGRTEAVCVHAVRKDGFNGEIEISLKDAPEGFRLSGGRIPEGVSKIRMTLTAPRKASSKPTVLSLQGRGRIGERTVLRPVNAAEDMMQAFSYRHLVCSKEFTVVFPGNRRSIPFERQGQVPIQIPAGGKAQVQFRVPNQPQIQKLQFELNEPPAGIRIEEVSVQDSRLAFTVLADGKEVQNGLKENLIVDVFMMVPRKDKDGKPTEKTDKVSFGTLPAIPFEVTKAHTNL